MSQITWTEDFVLGIEPFDAHHRHLISLINETTRCLETGASQEDAQVILNSLVDYAWYHFNAEEKWMKENKYPQYEDHHTIHQDFARKIIGYQNRFTDGDAAVIAELSSYLNFWLIDHIIICDSQYATFAGTVKSPVVMT